MQVRRSRPELMGGGPFAWQTRQKKPEPARKKAFKSLPCFDQGTESQNRDREHRAPGGVGGRGVSDREPNCALPGPASGHDVLAYLVHQVSRTSRPGNPVHLVLGVSSRGAWESVAVWLSGLVSDPEELTAALSRSP